MSEGYSDVPVRLELVSRLTKDIRNQTATLSSQEIRYIVSTYYMLQNYRIRSAHQRRDLVKAESEHALVQYLEEQFGVLEQAVKSCMAAYAETHIAGRWAMEQKGIGPVLAAALLAYIDINQAPTVGHIWRYAGLDPTVKWEKGQKRPWNATLKVVCWKIGESFVFVSGDEKAYYGQVYKKRKELENARNEARMFADQAAISLASKRFGEDTVARSYYEKGMLPPARIHLRSERYAAKLFLSHLHHVWYEADMGKPPPLPFPIAHLQHVHFLPPPGHTPIAA